MDPLTHVFVPLLVAYVLRPGLFPSPWYLPVGVVGLVPDFDKFLGLQGAFHSVFTLGVVAVGLVAVERWYRGEATYATLVAALLGSHLVLDFLGGSPVPVLYPLFDSGFALSYPQEVVIGDTVSETGVKNPAPDLKDVQPSRTRTTYPIVDGYGVLSALVFALVYVADRATVTDGGR